MVLCGACKNCCRNCLIGFGFDEVVPLVSLAKQKRMISNTWVLFPKKEMHGGGKEGEA